MNIKESCILTNRGVHLVQLGLNAYSKQGIEQNIHEYNKAHRGVIKTKSICPFGSSDPESFICLSEEKSSYMSLKRLNNFPNILLLAYTIGENSENFVEEFVNITGLRLTLPSHSLVRFMQQAREEMFFLDGLFQVLPEDSRKKLFRYTWDFKL